MIPLRFVISRIYAGWFDVHLCRDGAVLHGLSASDVWGNDAPRAGRISQKAEVCFREEIDFPLFVRSVYEAFLPWAQKQTQYAGSWMPFPSQEWSAFQGRVRELGWDLDSTEQKVEPCTPAT